jgi:Ran GTPase-activating protein (RanGAP) involved in mRNA processing and transport
VQAANLSALTIILQDDVAVCSWKALAAMGALGVINTRSRAEQFNATTLQSLSAALRHGVLPILRAVGLNHCDLSDEDIKDFMEALEASGCAERLVSLKISDCDIKGEGLPALAGLIAHDGFPALETLSLEGNSRITDSGVVALAKAILDSTVTLLTHLDLNYVGMGDIGMKALASLVYEGRMQQLEDLDLSGNST